MCAGIQGPVQKLGAYLVQRESYWWREYAVARIGALCADILSTDFGETDFNLTQNAAHVSEHGIVKTMAPYDCHLCCLGLTSSPTQLSAQRDYPDNVPSVLRHYASVSWRVVELWQKLIPQSCRTGILLPPHFQDPLSSLCDAHVTVHV